MPVIDQSDYRPPAMLFNGHFQTIYPALMRKVRLPDYYRERVTTADDDFIDLDWLKSGNSHVVIICHGLEGNSSRAYVTGLVSLLASHSYDALAWNYRGCSGEPNKHAYSYHSGATEDLETVVGHAVAQGYKKISVIGFSLGGNLTLKYLGESTTHKPKELVTAVAFSVPLDLHDCAIQIHKRSNFLYERRFLRSFFKKVKEKSGLFEAIDQSLLKKVKSVFDFDEYYTAPLSGFQNAVDYYNKCSSINFVQDIQIPTLVVNALNDPFLGPKCFDETVFRSAAHVSFQRPEKGGHCGFPLFNADNIYWSETTALSFIQENS